MGWGAKRATPQPDPDVAIAEKALKGPFVSGAELEERLAAMGEKDANRIAELEWMRLQANKGWLPERRERTLREFIASKGLYSELITYAKKLR